MILPTYNTLQILQIKYLTQINRICNKILLIFGSNLRRLYFKKGELNDRQRQMSFFITTLQLN